MKDNQGAIPGSREPSPASGLGPSGFDPEREAYYISVVRAIDASGLSPGFGRVIDADDNTFTIALTICNHNVERAKEKRPPVFAEELALARHRARAA